MTGLPDPLHALTLIRPWSDAIVRGPKRVENRPWAPWPRVLGQYIAIHAGAKYDDDACASLRGSRRHDGYRPPLSADSPRGIVGIARVVGYLSTVHARNAHTPVAAHAARVMELDSDPGWVGPVGWLLDDVTAVDPVPCTGALGLWRVPPAIRREVEHRWAEARRAAEYADDAIEAYRARTRKENR